MLSHVGWESVDATLCASPGRGARVRAGCSVTALRPYLHALRHWLAAGPAFRPGRRGPGRLDTVAWPGASRSALPLGWG